MRKFKAVSLIQRPGQAVFVPGGCAHQVMAQENSVSISFNYVDMNYLKIPFEDIMDCCQCSNIKDGKEVLTRYDLQRLHEAPEWWPVYGKSIMMNNPSLLDSATLNTKYSKVFHDKYILQVENGECSLFMSGYSVFIFNFLTIYLIFFQNLQQNASGQIVILLPPNPS